MNGAGLHFPRCPRSNNGSTSVACFGQPDPITKAARRAGSGGNTLMKPVTPREARVGDGGGDCWLMPLAASTMRLSLVSDAVMRRAQNNTYIGRRLVPGLDCMLPVLYYSTSSDPAASGVTLTQSGMVAGTTGVGSVAAVALTPRGYIKLVFCCSVCQGCSVPRSRTPSKKRHRKHTESAALIGKGTEYRNLSTTRVIYRQLSTQVVSHHCMV